MKYLISMFSVKYTLILSLSILSSLSISCSKTTEIIVQDMLMNVPSGESVFKEELLPGEIAETTVEHIAFVGPTIQSLQFSQKNVNLLLFIKGNGQLKSDTSTYQLVPESIAIPMSSEQVSIEVPEGEELHFVQFTKKLSEEDFKDMKEFQDENKYDFFFTRFEDCEAYTEPIKSPNTISRTVLPGDIIPRVSLGTVQAPGPDRVGAHEHPMLDQLFLGLANNDVMVHADGVSARLGEFSLLHIPIGSSHGVSVEEDKMMYYMWMDFFLTREGQEWLKTHKPVASDGD